MLREDRLEKLRDRHEARADKAEAEAESRFKYVDTMVGIMQGEPIKVGHHSEKRHRRDHERVDTNMRKGIQAGKQASHSRGLADTVEHSGISVEDDDAQSLLDEKIAKMEEKQAYMKSVNKQWRKRKGDASRVAELGRQYQGWELSNNNANIKRCKARKIELAKVAEIEDDKEVAAGTCEGKAFHFVTDTADHRLRFESPRLSKDACKILRQHGFKWSPNRNAWVRLLNLNAIGAAVYYVTPELKAMP